MHSGSQPAKQTRKLRGGGVERRESRLDTNYWLQLSPLSRFITLSLQLSSNFKSDSSADTSTRTIIFSSILNNPSFSRSSYSAHTIIICVLRACTCDTLCVVRRIHELTGSTLVPTLYLHELRAEARQNLSISSALLTVEEDERQEREQRTVRGFDSATNRTTWKGRKDRDSQCTLYCHFYWQVPLGEQCQTQNSLLGRCSTATSTSTRNHHPSQTTRELYRTSIPTRSHREPAEIRVCRKYGPKIITTLTIRVRGSIQTKGCERGLADHLLHRNPFQGLFPSNKNSNRPQRDLHEPTSDH